MRVKANAAGLMATAFVVGAAFVAIYLQETVYLDALATPTAICQQEIELAVGLFVVFLFAVTPTSQAISRNKSKVSSLLRAKVILPVPIRAVAVLLLVGGLFVFAFWSIADVLGGYNGYGYSFQVYPILHTIHNSTIGLIPYLGTRDKGTQASFFLGVAILGMVTLRLGSGLGKAIVDTATLFAAPILVVFELALWPNAPEDMTWHVTDYLWIGGTNDGGYRALDTGGAYILSNWLLLAICILLVATRIPWVSVLSAVASREGPDAGLERADQTKAGPP